MNFALKLFSKCPPGCASNFSIALLKFSTTATTWISKHAAVWCVSARGRSHKMDFWTGRKRDRDCSAPCGQLATLLCLFVKEREFVFFSKCRWFLLSRTCVSWHRADTGAATIGRRLGRRRWQIHPRENVTVDVSRSSGGLPDET